MPTYLITGNHPGFQSYYTPAVTYEPDADRPIGFCDGFGAHAPGGAYGYTEALQKRRWLEQLNAKWFVPFLERLARGEEVPVEEIQKAYFDLFGKQLPCRIHNESFQ